MSNFDTEETKEILFPDEETLNRPASESFSEQLRNEFAYKRLESNAKINPELLEVANEHKIYTELAEFIREHIKSVGQEQAVKDFQCGLNFLHKDIADLLKEDGDYGEKTFAAFYEVLQHYPIEVVKEAILRGAKSNVGIDYEYSIDEEPETLIENVEENLNKEEI